MASNGDNAPFRFLDLPSELRCRVYDFVFEDTHAAGELLLLTTPHYYATTNLTTVSHRIRNECIELYKRTAATSWASHTFHIVINGEAGCDGTLKRFGKVKRLPRGAVISGLSYWFSSRFHAGPGGEFFIRARCGVQLGSPGDVAWTCTTAPRAAESQQDLALMEHQFARCFTMFTTVVDTENEVAAEARSAWFVLPRTGMKGTSGFTKAGIIALYRSGQSIWVNVG